MKYFRKFTKKDLQLNFHNKIYPLIGSSFLFSFLVSIPMLVINSNEQILNYIFLTIFALAGIAGIWELNLIIKFIINFIKQPIFLIVTLVLIPLANYFITLHFNSLVNDSLGPFSLEFAENLQFVFTPTVITIFLLHSLIVLVVLKYFLDLIRFFISNFGKDELKKNYFCKNFKKRYKLKTLEFFNNFRDASKLPPQGFYYHCGKIVTFVIVIFLLGGWCIALHTFLVPKNFKRFYISTAFHENYICGIHNLNPKTLPKNGFVLEVQADKILKKKCKNESDTANNLSDINSMYYKQFINITYSIFDENLYDKFKNILNR